MRTTAVTLASIGLSVLLAGPGFAQQATTGTNPPASTAAPAVAPPNDKGPAGSLEKSHGEWRASKLIGADVYNRQGQTIGSVDDFLMRNDGQVSEAVISVGGFLGIGAKLVSVPFDHLKFEPSKTSAPANNVASAPAANPPGAAGGTMGGAAGAGSSGGIAADPGAQTAPATSTGTAGTGGNTEQYYSIVIPDATKDSLSKAPEFKYNG